MAADNRRIHEARLWIVLYRRCGYARAWGLLPEHMPWMLASPAVDADLNVDDVYSPHCQPMLWCVGSDAITAVLKRSACWKIVVSSGDGDRIGNRRAEYGAGVVAHSPASPEVPQPGRIQAFPQPPSPAGIMGRPARLSDAGFFVAIPS